MGGDLICGISMEKGTRIAAIFNLFLGAVFLVFNVIYMMKVIPMALEENKQSIPKDPRIQSMIAVLLTINTVDWAMNIGLSILLIFAANQRNIQKCRAWLIMTCMLVLLYLVEIFMNVFSLRSTAIQIASPVVGTLYGCFLMWIVSKFMVEIRRSC